MDLADEESKSNNDEDIYSDFPLISIYNKFPLASKDSSGNIIKDDKYIYICGKMFKHSSQAKYNFPACEFYLYSPNTNELYHSNMNSEDCFTNTLQWNYKLFKNIRECLTNSEVNFKRYYFIINNSSSREKASKEKDDLEIEANRIYLELHFFIKKKDIVSFRLLLEEIIENEPYLYFIDKVIKLDNEYVEELEKKKRKKYKQDKELEEIKVNIKQKNDVYEKKIKEMIIKFKLLKKSKMEETKKLELKLKNNEK